MAGRNSLLLATPALPLAVECEQAERHLYRFLHDGWHVLEPETEFVPGWHIELVAEYLELVTQGDIKRLIINEPPKHTKSLLCTVFWPVWWWVRSPALRLFFTSYSSTLSTEHSVKRRQLIESQWFQDCWGDRFKLSGDQNVKTHFENDHRGAMFAASLSSGVTGMGGACLIIDDPHDADNQDNANAIKEDVERYRRTTPSRLNNPREGAIVMIGHRVNVSDLTAWMLAAETKQAWTHVVLRAEAEKDETWKFPMSGRVLARKEGEPLQPMRIGVEELRNAKVDQGERRYAGLYQQRPSPLGGNILKRESLRYYYPKGSAPDIAEEDRAKTIVLPSNFDEILQSWDFSFKDKKDSDFVGGHIWARERADKFLLARVHRRMGFSESVRAVKYLTETWPQAHRKLFEDAANGPAVEDTLRHELPGIILVPPLGSKTERFEAATYDCDSGNVYVPHPSICPWISEVIQQWVDYPGVPHDEDCDCFSQAMLVFRKSPLRMPTSGVIIGQARPEERRIEHQSFRKMNF